jgi:hypothetical protein
LLEAKQKDLLTDKLHMMCLGAPVIIKRMDININRVFKLVDTVQPNLKQNTLLLLHFEAEIEKADGTVM